jgi:hypothetical protein
MLPWREVPGGDREVGLPCKIPKKINCTDKDGSIAKLPISYGELQALDVERKHGGPQPGNLFELEVESTKHKLAILQKVDRHLLLILSEQSRQICMVKVSLCGGVADEMARLKHDDPVLQRALACMSKLAKIYASGTTRRTELNDKRNELLNEMGITGKKRTMVVKANSEAKMISKQIAKPKAKCTAAKMARLQPLASRAVLPPRLEHRRHPAQPLRECRLHLHVWLLRRNHQRRRCSILLRWIHTMS